jgi:CelD/BcsL family acetyltransferase involved in cellulose biosynthesis
VFSTWEWLSTWWSHFGKARRLIILSVESENEILFIAPLVYSQQHFLGFGKLKKISFAGSPEADYASFILKEKNPKFLELIFDYLNTYIDWDYLQLKDVPEYSATLNLILKMQLKRQYKKLDIKQSISCPFISLPDSMNAYLKSLSRGMRKNLKRYSQKLGKKHKVELKNYNEIGSIKEAMNIFFRLHQMRWKFKGELGAFNESIIRDFHIDLAERFAEKGWLKLNFLTMNDEPIAARYGFEYGQKVYSYLSGWNPKYSQYRIGSLTLMYEIQKSIQKRLKEYDLGRGDEAYKRLWTTKARKNYTITFVKKRLLPQIYLLLKNSKINFLLSNCGIPLVRARND